MARWSPRELPRTDGWELRLHTWAIAHRTPHRTRHVRRLTRAGSSPAIGLMLPVAAAGLAYRSTRSPQRAVGDAAEMAGVVAAGLIVRRVLMLAVRRARPPDERWAYHATGFAFPSGHSANAALAAGLLVGTLSRRQSVRQSVRESARGAARESPSCLSVSSAVAASAGASYAAAVGASRVYLGVHWPSDVLAGWLVGLSWSALGPGLVRRAVRRLV